MKAKRGTTSKHQRKEDSQFADAMRNLMAILRTNEANYLQHRAPGKDLPDRKHVIEASMASLMSMRKIFGSVGRFEFATLPVHLDILFGELATVRSGVSSSLFQTGQRKKGGKITYRILRARAYSVVLVDLLMEKHALDRKPACEHVATALREAGFADLSWETILDWRKRAHARRPGTKFQVIYDLARKILPGQIKPEETLVALMASYSRWLRAHLYQ